MCGCRVASAIMFFLLSSRTCVAVRKCRAAPVSALLAASSIILICSIGILYGLYFRMDLLWRIVSMNSSC